MFINFGRGLYGEYSCKVILNLDKWFRRRCHLKKKFKDDGQRLITKAHLKLNTQRALPKNVDPDVAFIEERK